MERLDIDLEGSKTGCQISLLHIDAISHRRSAQSSGLSAETGWAVRSLTLHFSLLYFQTRMQSLQPDPAARYRNVLEALWRIIRTEGLWRPMRGLNVTATGAGPAHALYFACYEKLKKTLSDVIHPGGNSHIANGIEPSCAGSPTFPTLWALLVSVLSSLSMVWNCSFGLG